MRSSRPSLSTRAFRSVPEEMKRAKEFIYIHIRANVLPSVRPSVRRGVASRDRRTRPTTFSRADDAPTDRCSFRRSRTRRSRTRTTRARETKCKKIKVPARSGRDSSIATRRRPRAPVGRGRGRPSSEATRSTGAVVSDRRFDSIRCIMWLNIEWTRRGFRYMNILWFEYWCDGSSRLENCVRVLQNCVRNPARGSFFFVRLIDDDAVIVFVLECPSIVWSLFTGVEEFLSHRELGRERRREFEIVVVTETFPVRLTLCIEGFFE
jgi:hypothetical protein